MAVVAKHSETKRRIDICEKCEKLWATFKVCSVCKCPIKTKTQLQASTCPIGKW